MGLSAAAVSAVCAWPLYRAFGSAPEGPFDSPNWRDGEFRNLPDAYINYNLSKEPEYTGGWLKFLFARNGDRFPPGPVPAIKSDLKSLRDGQFVWLGHSSLLLKLNGKVICFDPVLSSRASPVPFTIPAWGGSEPWRPEDFPKIDYLCISHDHWDHLDCKALDSLRYDQIICGLGVKSHLESWGVSAPAAVLDWGDEHKDGGIRFVFTPSRHFSGRGLQRNHTLWGGFAISSADGAKVYFSGDGGYGGHFRDIGERFGPFNAVFPDSGQYNRAWPHVHMFPEEAAVCARDTAARLACPVHHGKFTLSWHPWDEPPKRFRAAAERIGLPFVLPKIGEIRDMPS